MEISHDVRYTSLVFVDKDALNKALSRIATYYENVLHRDKYISLAEWETTSKTLPKHTGFNAPLSTLVSWSQLAGTDVSAEERSLLDALLSKHARKDTRPYVIAYLKGDHETLAHEKRHILYHYDPMYRKQSDVLWNKLTEAEQRLITAELINRRYHCDHHVDEFQAYMACDPFTFGSRGAKHLTAPTVRGIQKQLLDWDMAAVLGAREAGSSAGEKSNTPSKKKK